MHLRFFILLSLILLGTRFVSQTQYSVIPPDSIRTKCEKAIVSEIGKNAFLHSVKLIKCDLNSTADMKNYTLFYAFIFPSVKESHVIFTMNCLTDQKGSHLVKDTAFRNFTRLPLALKSKNIAAISYENAKKIAAQSNPVLKAGSDKMYGELSTDYDPKLKDYYFAWHFYLMEPCKNCGSEQFRIHSAAVDAVSGKVIPAPKTN